MKILKIRFFHVRKGPNIGIKSNFQGPMTSNGWDYPGQPQIGPFLTLGYMAAPLKNEHFENPFFSCHKGSKYRLWAKFSWPYNFKLLILSRTTENGPNFNIEGNGQPPLKMKILKICFFHVRKGPNIGSEPDFHGPMTSTVKDYPEQPKILTLRVYVIPP